MKTLVSTCDYHWLPLVLKHWWSCYKCPLWKSQRFKRSNLSTLIGQHSVLCIHVSAFVCFSFPKHVFSVLKALTQKKIGSWSFRSAGFKNVVPKRPSSLRSTFKLGISTGYITAATSGIASGPSGIGAMVSCTPSFGVFSLNCFTKHDNWQNIQNDACKSIRNQNEIKYFIDVPVIVSVTLKSWSQYVFWVGDQGLWSS